MMFKEQQNINNSQDLLDISKNFRRKIVSSELKNSSHLNKDFALKRILLVYVYKDGRKFIEKMAAYSLGLINVRPVMLDSTNELYEITDDVLIRIKNKDIELKFMPVTLENSIPQKEKIQVFNDGIDCYITLSAAYSLGLISDKNFANMQGEYYKVSDNLLVFLEKKYDVIYTELPTSCRKIN